MKTLEVNQANQSLAFYALNLGDELLVLTHNDEPVAAIVSLKDIDLETLALGSNTTLQEILALSRADSQAGRTLTLEEMKRQVAQMDEVPATN